MAPVDISVVQAHVSRLRDCGLGSRQIAKQAKVSRQVVKAVLRHSTVRNSSRHKLLAAKPIVAPHTLVPGLPAWRVVKWLESEGFTRPRIAKLVGVSKIVLRKRYTMRVVARLRRLKRYFESQDPGKGGPFGSEPTSQ